MGFGLSKTQLKAKTGKIVKSLKLKTGFKNDTPGDDWFRGLQKRHPDIAMKKPQKLSVTRARAMNKSSVDKYFGKLKETIDKLNVQSHHIWNCDETNVQLEHKPTSVVGRKGGRVPGRVAHSKESVTVLGCGNAAGKIMSPMVIVKGKTRKSLMGWKTEDAPSNTKWAFQPKSYMDQVLGVEWFQNVFLKECGEHRPQLLTLDSHCSHEPVELIEIAEKEKITLLTFPSHCTHWLQPWDKSMFAPLKRKYNSLCSEYMAENNTHNITKRSWPLLFCKAWESAVTEVNMVSGFVSTGIWPFNPNAIPEQAYLASYADTAVHAEGPMNQDASCLASTAQITSDTSNVAIPTVPTTPDTSNLVIPAAPTTPDTSNLVITTAPTTPGTSNILVSNAQMNPGGGNNEARGDSNQFVVQAEVHQGHPSIVTLDLPILVDEGTKILSLPVGFDNENLLQDSSVPPDFSGVTLEEVKEADFDLPSNYWNTDVESIFLPKIEPPVPSKKRIGASSSRILTSPEIIKAKREMAELKEKKAKAALERKAKAEERKLIAQEKKQAKARKVEAKEKKGQAKIKKS